MRPHQPPNLTLHLIYGEVIGMLFGLLCLYDLADFRSTVSTIIATTIFGGVLGFLVWLVRQQDQNKKFDRKKHIADIRKTVRQRAEASRIAQLNKPDFQTRLSQFVGSDVKLDLHSAGEKGKFRSRLPFWQLAPVSQCTPPKPIEFIRRLLQHISKVVRGGCS